MIREWLQTNLGDVEEASNGDELRVNCPFCEARQGTPDTKKHMYVNLDSPKIHCFRCDWGGNYVGLVISVTGCSYSDAMMALAACDAKPSLKMFEKLYSPKGEITGAHHVHVPDNFIWFSWQEQCMLSKAYKMEFEATYNYLRHKRKLPTSLILAHCGMVPGTNRAWFIIDKEWWQGRSIIDQDPKYVSPPWGRGDALWNYSALTKYDEIVICEGVISAIAAGDNAVALCGKTITKMQATRLADAVKVKQYVVMLDAGFNDEAFAVAAAIHRAGFIGSVKIYFLKQGQPTDGLEGHAVNYDGPLTKALWELDQPTRSQAFNYQFTHLFGKRPYDSSH